MSSSVSVTISVLLPAYNAERYILQSVQSVLGQTFEDFELVVVDDCSTDGTSGILASIADARLRVIRNPVNLGVVGTLNRAMSAARGRLIARTDADDYCLPTRFARQKAFLDQNPNVLMVGARMFNLEDGKVTQNPRVADADPQVLRWQQHITNRMGHPSMMFRAEVVSRLGTYLREEFKYAEDFDFTHRVLRIGDAAVLPDHLMIYRQHGANLTRRHRAEMISKAVAVLAEAYAGLLGPDSGTGAALIGKHLVSGIPVSSRVELAHVGTVLDRLVEAFTAANPLTSEQAAKVVGHAAAAWWGAVQNALRNGIVVPADFGPARFQLAKHARPPLRRLAWSAAAGLLDGGHKIANWRSAWASGRASRRDDSPVHVQGTRLEPAAIHSNDPPCLYVVVDTEAEFDWSKDFDRSLTAVTAMAFQERAQAVFDHFGVRPLYVVDYAVASQPEGYEPLRAILGRHACAIGAHLHPWINPPYEEIVSQRNSFAGNLPKDLEERKLRVLCNAIRENFGISPLFFKAGRYGLGSHTLETLKELGFAVDLSIMPRSDGRAKGGVDFRSVDARPYRAASGQILSVPMTRAHLGPLAPLAPAVHAAMHSPLMTSIGLPGILAHLGLLNTVTLTPEGISAKEQVQLLRTQVRRGYRTFVLHYHSPSLSPGHTPYVRTDSDLARFLGRISDVCNFFFDQIGGMPGHPADLLPQNKRDQLWPAVATQPANDLNAPNRTPPLSPLPSGAV